MALKEGLEWVITVAVKIIAVKIAAGLLLPIGVNIATVFLKTNQFKWHVLQTWVAVNDFSYRWGT